MCQGDCSLILTERLQLSCGLMKLQSYSNVTIATLHKWWETMARNTWAISLFNSPCVYSIRIINWGKNFINIWKLQKFSITKIWSYVYSVPYSGKVWQILLIISNLLNPNTFFYEKLHSCIHFHQTLLLPNFPNIW